MPSKAYLLKLDDSYNGKMPLKYRRSDSLDIKSKCITATEIRDNLDMWCQAGSSMYGFFLEKAIPVFLKLLDGKPVFDSNLPEQVRCPLHRTNPTVRRSCDHAVLEILHRLPMTADINEGIAYKIIDRLMDLIKIENEDNDILIVKTIMDLMRHNPKVMKERVQPFLSGHHLDHVPDDG